MVENARGDAFAADLREVLITRHKIHFKRQPARLVDLGGFATSKAFALLPVAFTNFQIDHADVSWLTWGTSKVFFLVYQVEPSPQSF